jgi:glycerate 2-kinase
MERDLKKILDTALAAAEPGKTVGRFLSAEGGRVMVGDESYEPERVFVLAVGKASGPMARAAREALGETLSGGLCVIKGGHEEPPQPFETIVAGHPEPDDGSVRAAERAQKLLEGLEEGDLLLVLV